MYNYLVFLVCYLPYVIILVSIETNGPSIVFQKIYLFSITLTYLNSSFNPVIYCWKIRRIRHAVINILRNMSWLRSCSSIETIESAGHTMPWCNDAVTLQQFLIQDVVGERNRSIYKLSKWICQNTEKIKLCYKQLEIQRCSHKLVGSKGYTTLCYIN